MNCSISFSGLRRSMIPLIIASASLSAWGCRDAVAPEAAPIDRSLLTGEAAQSLNADGQFILPQHGALQTAEILGEDAKNLAAALWRASALVVPTLEHDRGGTIHTKDLQPCVRAYYVESAYSAVPADAPDVIQKALGPQWLVGLCYDNVEEVVVSVSAFATDAKLTADGRQLAQAGTSNFLSMGVPLGTEIPTPPEGLANASAKTASRRVSLVPLLTMRPRPASAITAVWQVTFETPAQVVGRDSHVTRQKQTVFAGALDGWNKIAYADALAGAPDDKGREDFVYSNGTAGSVPRTYTATRRADVPNVMELITFGAP